MRITIVYDNEAKKPGLIADHGFSCLIEAPDTPRVLFDTGAKGSILLHNMKELKIEPRSIGVVVISHNHGDHFGGLQAITEANQDAELYLPHSFEGGISAKKVTRVKGPLEIRHGIFTTGEVGGMEQSLAIKTDKGLVVITGCAHPGVGNILDAAARLGKACGIIGGLHGFHDFDRLNPLSLICPCHCTQYKSEIKRLFPDRCLDCGAGLVLEP
jgi:7,8-dihydropterin-6-yl-methyl-4-(beta-D-ribofuranosyl)aminobenzene 5'-phosphate synthase